MNYVFKRTKKVQLSNWNHTLTEMKEELRKTLEGCVTEEEAQSFFLKAAEDVYTQYGNPGMYFWGFDDPSSMPGDARCDYFYRPTYLVVLTMVLAVLRYPRLLENPENIRLLQGGLWGCTGRGLRGFGFEGLQVLVENLFLFLRNRIKDFLDAYPELCPSFTQMFNEIIATVQKDYERGNTRDEWRTDYVKQFREVLNLWDGSEKS